MNENNVPTVPGEASALPSEVAPRKSDLVPETRRAGANEYIEVYQHVPPVFGFTLGDLVEVIKQRRRYLLVGAIVGVQLAILVLILTTPLFAVSAQVVITQQAPGQLIDTDSGSSAFIATQAEVIQSLAVVRAAVATLPPPAYLELEGDAVADALNAVSASAISGTRVVALSYLGADPNYGAALLNAMVAVYLSEVRDSTRLGQKKLLDTKSGELEEILAEVARQELQLNELRQDSSIIGTADDAADAENERLSDTVRESMKARSRRIELQSRLASSRTALTGDDRFRDSLREELRQAESELAKVRRILTAEHPAAVAAERDVEVLRAQLASSDGGSRSDLRQQVDEAARVEAELVAIEAKSRARLKVIETHRRKEKTLLAELERTQSQANEMRRELRNQRLISRLAEAGDVGTGARIIEEPVVPDQPVWPKKKFMLLAGAVLGLAVGFVFALISLRRKRDPGVVEW